MENKRLFQKYYSRLAKEGVAKALILGFIVGFSASMIPAVISFFIKLNGIWLSVGVGLAAVIITTPIFYHFLFRPKIKQIAEKIDRLGLNERLITMLQLENDESYIAMRQREDAKEKLSEVRREMVKLSIFKVFKVPMILLLALAVGSSSMITASALSFKHSAEPYEESIYLEINYSAESGGYIYGEARQSIVYGQDAATVVAVAGKGQMFLGWSDGVETPIRTDKNITQEIEVTALFAKAGGDAGKGESSFDYLKGIVFFLLEYRTDFNRLGVISIVADGRKNKICIHLNENGKADDITALVQHGGIDPNLLCFHVYDESCPEKYYIDDYGWVWRNCGMFEYLFLTPCENYSEKHCEIINSSYCDCSLTGYWFYYSCPCGMSCNLEDISAFLSDVMYDYSIYKIETDIYANKAYIYVIDKDMIGGIIALLQKNGFNMDVIYFHVNPCADLFSHEYLVSISEFLTEYTSDFGIYILGVDYWNNRVCVYLTDENMVDGIILLLKQNGFYPGAVDFYVEPNGIRLYPDPVYPSPVPPWCGAFCGECPLCKLIIEYFKVIS